MADNDQNDEYKFEEFDSLDNESMGDIDSGLNKDFSSGQQEPATARKDIKRNALIVVALIIVIIILYKIFGSMFFSNKKESTVPVAEITPLTQTTQIPVVVTPTPMQQVQPIQTATALDASQDLQKRVAAIELSQQSLRTEVSAIRDQLGGLNSSINSLNTQIGNLSQVVSNLSNQVTKQSEEISVLMARSQPKQVRAPVVRQIVPVINYYIQAVIPGRAWLIGSNGSTLTVREGTKISGYGVVKLIDSLQGHILTSSGRVIKFSQEDS